MNDNAGQLIPPTVIPPREEVQALDVRKQVKALIEIWEAVRDCDDVGIAMANPALQSLNPETILTTIDACLNMALPGSNLYARGIGIVEMKMEDGRILMGVAMDLYPGKTVVLPMLRETAENFEKVLRISIDKHFGRIIKP